MCLADLGRLVRWVHTCMCVSGRSAVCSLFSVFWGEKTARQVSTINMLIYAATSSFHYAYNHHWSRVCSPLFLMYESLSCGEQGQNQQSCVDLCSSWFPATIVHQCGTLTLFTGQTWALPWLWLVSLSPPPATAAVCQSSGGHSFSFSEL